MSEQPQYPGAPRWVKLFIAVILVVIVAFALLLHARRGGHGPGQHMRSERTR